MDKQAGSIHKFRNRFQTLLLTLAMVFLLGTISRLTLGPEFWPWLALLLLIITFGLPRISPTWVLKLYKARPIDPRQSPPLYMLVRELSERAGLHSQPAIFWIPSQTLNAFAVGSPARSAIAVTEGLLRVLSPQELAGVLAHEISHIKNNDLRLLMLADLFTRLSYFMSLAGITVVLIALPWIVMGYVEVSAAVILLLLAIPSISALLQLGLSRVREFDADLDAAKITQDPAALARALIKIEQQQINPWQRIFMPGYREYQPSILRTHPTTEERVARLHSLLQSGSIYKQPFTPNFRSTYHAYSHIPVAHPRQRFFTGIWR